MMKELAPKAAIVGLVLLIAFMVYYHINQQNKLNQVLKQNQVLIERLEAEKKALIQRNTRVVDSLKRVDAQEREQLLHQNRNLQARIRSYEARPDINLDFLAAADVIARSQYRPGQ